jgi:hypothetical protein
MDQVRPVLLAATLDHCLTVPAAMGILLEYVPVSGPHSASVGRRPPTWSEAVRRGIAVPEGMSRCPHLGSTYRAGRVRLGDLLGNDCGVLTDPNE